MEAFITRMQHTTHMKQNESLNFIGVKLFISQTYQWRWKQLPLMLSFAEVNTLGQINIIYCD